MAFKTLITFGFLVILSTVLIQYINCQGVREGKLKVLSNFQNKLIFLPVTGDKCISSNGRLVDDGRCESQQCPGNSKYAIGIGQCTYPLFCCRSSD